jgi:hypothetical protein
MLAYSHILNQGAFTKYTKIAKKRIDTIIVGKVLKMEVTNSSLVDGNNFVVLHTTHVISYWQQK